MPFKWAGPARRTKVGGEAAHFPLRHPFRFHVRRFPNDSALRSLPPPPPLRPLTCGPDPGKSEGDPAPSRRGRREGGSPAAAVQEWGPGRGRGRAPSQRPPARGTQPLSAASRAHKPRRRRQCVTVPRAPRPRPRPPIGRQLSRCSPELVARGVLGVVVLLGRGPPGSWGGCGVRSKAGES